MLFSCLDILIFFHVERKPSPNNLCLISISQSTSPLIMSTTPGFVHRKNTNVKSTNVKSTVEIVKPKNSHFEGSGLLIFYYDRGFIAVFDFWKIIVWHDTVRFFSNLSRLKTVTWTNAIIYILYKYLNGVRIIREVRTKRAIKFLMNVTFRVLLIKFSINLLYFRLYGNRVNYELVLYWVGCVVYLCETFQYLREKGLPKLPR